VQCDDVGTVGRVARSLSLSQFTLAKRNLTELPVVLSLHQSRIPVRAPGPDPGALPQSDFSLPTSMAAAWDSRLLARDLRKTIAAATSGAAGDGVELSGVQAGLLLFAPGILSRV
jgi:hypothetical protein